MGQEILGMDPHTGVLQVKPDTRRNDVNNLYKHAFYDKEKPHYLSKVKREFDYWKKIWSLRLSLMEKKLQGPKEILDIGAGGGFFLNVARNRGWVIDGIEPSKHAVSYAKKEFNIELKEGLLEDIQQLEFPVTTIHMSFVLEHVPDPVSFIQKALKNLKRNGLLWVEVPNDFNPLQNAITSQLGKNQWWIVPEHHLNYFNYDSLSKLLCRQGTEELERLGSFPVEFFALMGLDYIDNEEMGSKIHEMRMKLEEHIINYDSNILLALYRSLATAKLGRSCNILVRKH